MKQFFSLKLKETQTHFFLFFENLFLLIFKEIFKNTRKKTLTTNDLSIFDTKKILKILKFFKRKSWKYWNSLKENLENIEKKILKILKRKSWKSWKDTLLLFFSSLSVTCLLIFKDTNLFTQKTLTSSLFFKKILKLIFSWNLSIFQKKILKLILKSWNWELILKSWNSLVYY